MKISATVVTYNPNFEHVSNIMKISSQFDKVYVVDNSEKRKDILDFKDSENISLIENGKNLGIANALNFGLNQSFQDGFDICATFDQDSTIDDNFRASMEEKAVQCIEKDSSTIIVAPNFFDRNSKSFAMFSKLTKWTCKNFRLESSIDELIPSSFAITSGALIFLDNFRKVGEYNEEYFIDHVDSEFCLRAQRLGYSTYIAPSVVLNHSIGNRTKHKLLGITIKANNHSPQRRYFIIRNGIAMTVDNFFVFPSHTYLCFARLVHELLAIVFFEDDKFKKTKAVTFGVIDGFLKNFNNRFRF